MKKLSSVTISGGLTVDQATTLSGVVSVGGIGTGAYTSVLVRNSSNQMIYRNFSDFVNDVSGSLNLSGYVPTSRTITINGTTYDLSADRTWTITTPYVSKLQHTVKAGVAINKGQAVYVTSADGTNMIVGLASNASEATSSKTMGLLDATVSTNGFANVVTEGLLAGLDTSTAGTEGDPVWLGTGGNLIYGLANKPYAPAHLVFIGIVTRKNANNGEIFVKVQNGFELNEIHDVDLITTAPINGHLLGYNGTLWVNKTIAGWLGYTPANASGTTNYLSKFTGSTTLGNSLVYDNGTNVGIGTATPGYKLETIGNARISGNLSIGTTYNGFAANIEGTVYVIGASVWVNDGYGYANASSSTGMYPDSSHNISFKSNNSTKVYINAAGNVGIGTTSPAANLHIQGSNAKIRLTGDTHTSIELEDGGTGDPGYLKTYYYGSLVAQVGAGGTFFNTGDVGIGTASPTHLLSLSRTTQAAAYQLNINTAGGISDGNFTGIRFSQDSNAATELGNIKLHYYSTGATDLSFGTRYSPTAVYIQSGGNVGIGTTSPSTKLDVNGVITATGGNSTNWNTAYGWGNHASAGYLTSVTNISGYSGTLLAEDNRTISPSELAAGQMKFGFTSWTNDNNSPYADFIHLRSYTDSSGGTDNLVMFKKSGIGMRIWQQTWGSTSPYAEYVDVWTTANFTQTNVNNWNTAYGWGNHASSGYLTSYSETDTLASVTGRGASTSTNITLSGAGNQFNGHHYFLAYDANGNHYPHYNAGSNANGSKLNLRMFDSSGNAVVFFLNGNDKSIQWDGYTIYHAGNIPTWNQNTTGSAGSLSSMNISQFTNNSGYITGYTETDTLASVTNRGESTTGRINVRGPGNQGGGNIMMGNTGEGVSKWSYLTSTHYNASSQPQGFALIGGLATSGGNAVVIGGNIYETNPATEIQFWTHSTNTHNLGGTQRGVINSSGNWGIGTTTPNQRLSVEGGSIQLNANNVAANYYLYLNKKSGQDGGILFNRDNASDWQLTNGAGNGDLIFYSYGTATEAITFKRGTGNVGIGTTSPSYKLHVVGDLYVNGTNGAFTTDNSQSNLYFLNLTRSTTSLVTAGNVGIKVANPTATLSLGTSSYDNNPLAGLEYSQVTGGGRLDLKVQTWGTGSDYALTTGLTVLTPGFNTNNVRVGIGTSSPATPLHVTGGASGTGGWNRTATLAATYPGLIFNSNGTKWGGMAYDYSAAMRFWVNANNDDIFAGTLALSILNNGNVGIGDTTPATKLVVDGVISATGGNSTNWNTAYGWGNHASAGYATTSYVTTQINNLIAGAPGALDTLDELAAALGDDASFATTVTNSIAAKLPLAGGTMTGDLVIGVGTATGSSQPFGDFSQLRFDNLHSDTSRGPNKIVMHDNGAAWIGGFGIHSDTVSYYTGGHHRWYKSNSQVSFTQVMQLDASGNLTIAGSLTESSSIKLKENVETSEGNLEKVVNLRPVTYNKIGSQTKELGLIAEEVATVYPEFVQYDENGEPIGVNYSRLTAALIGAVKELTNQVQELNKKING